MGFADSDLRLGFSLVPSCKMARASVRHMRGAVMGDNATSIGPTDSLAPYCISATKRVQGLGTNTAL